MSASQITFHYRSPLGVIAFTYDGKTLVRAVFVEGVKKSQDRILPVQVQKLFTALDGYFAGTKKKIPMVTFSFGTDLERGVWAALLEIPYGETRTYRDIAQVIGLPTAVRAVANAIAKNQLAILVPCHRVIGTDGKMHGYAWGVKRKEKLLRLEKGK